MAPRINPAAAGLDKQAPSWTRGGRSLPTRVPLGGTTQMRSPRVRTPWVRRRERTSQQAPQQNPLPHHRWCPRPPRRSLSRLTLWSHSSQPCRPVLSGARTRGVAQGGTARGSRWTLGPPGDPRAGCTSRRTTPRRPHGMQSWLTAKQEACCPERSPV